MFLSCFYYKVISFVLGGLGLWLFSLFLNMKENDLSYLVDIHFGGLVSLGFSFSMFFDWMSCLFLSFVLIITSSIIFYSVDYMAGDRRMVQFLLLLILFVGSMVMVVLSLNMVSIMLGWDGLGLVSYLLVIYYQNTKSNSAAMITALSNRIGDVAILVSIGVLVEAGGFEFMSGLEGSVSKYSGLLAGLVVLAAITKSAQIPFSAWLPEAMAAPTPVSALVHSSTLVTAGVYLIIRFSPIFEGSKMMGILLVLSMGTMIMSSLGANLETDMKKIVALSTLSQLGVMMISLSVGLSDLAFFHLLTHAAFKALLFMCAGEVIHESLGSQDIRFMGGLLSGLPFTGVVMNTTNLALCGFPFMAGFYSKDMIIESSLFSGYSTFFFSVMGLGVGLSASYSVRMSFLSQVSATGQIPCFSVSETVGPMFNSKFVLTLLSVVSGSMLSWLMFSSEDLIFLANYEKFLALSGTLMGFLMGYLLSSSHGLNLLSNTGVLGQSFISGMWFLGSITGGMSLLSAKVVGDYYEKMEFGWLELSLGKGSEKLIYPMSLTGIHMQSKGLKSFITVFFCMVLFSWLVL